MTARAWPLSRRLCAVFAALLLACCGISAALQIHDAHRHEQEVAQRLSRGLAAHIAAHSTLVSTAGDVNSAEVETLFHKLMDVNPSAELYLLGPDGSIRAQAAPVGHLKRERVDLAPVRRLLAGDALPIVGEDPRSDSGSKVFSAAALYQDRKLAGYVYVILLGEDHDVLARDVAYDGTWRTAGWSMLLVVLLGVPAGLAAFAWVTQPLRNLTRQVHQFDPDDAATLDGTLAGSAWPTLHAGSGDELMQLRCAFSRMSLRIAEQWRDLNQQDQQRRDLIANISHDLRTPLTSMHGYLETLKIKANHLTEQERQRYLDIALSQSLKVSRLAQELFELARLECGIVKPDKERFSLPDLVQDVLQKFELSAEARQQRLVADIAPSLPLVHADLGMIERVLTNLLDNAIRHAPVGGDIRVLLRSGSARGVEVQVSDNGPGVPERMHATLFNRPLLHAGSRPGSGGLGLVIVRRMLQLNGSDIRLAHRSDRGAVFLFHLHESLNSA